MEAVFAWEKMRILLDKSQSRAGESSMQEHRNIIWKQLLCWLSDKADCLV